MEFASKTIAAEDRTRWKAIVMSSMPLRYGIY